MTRFKTKTVVLSMLLPLCCSLVGCVHQGPSTATTKQAFALLNQAAKSPPENKQRYQLAAARLFLQQHHKEQASTVIQQVDEHLLSPEQHALKQILEARLNLLNHRPKATLYALSQLQSSDTLTEEAKVDLLNARSQALAETGYPLEAARALIQLDEFLEEPNSLIENRQKIWLLLNQASYEELTQIEGTSNVESGWFALAALMKQHAENPSLFNHALLDWSVTYPHHPAEHLLAAEANTDINRNAPRRIALLLPITGKLADTAHAVRNGFFSAYYKDNTHPKDRVITVYDTQNDTQVITRFTEALADGADLIIGPLTKEGVKQLNHLSDDTLQVPTITLNQIDSEDQSSSHPQVYQLALSPEDEIAEATNHAWQKGYSHALIIAPETAWGQRLAKNYQNHWTKLGGEIVDTLNFNPNNELSHAIQTLLHIPHSEARANQLKKMLNTTFEYEPRRRQDVDVIFIAASASQARQISPLLSFYYAANIPVYATSSVYSGINNPQQDRDLDGTTFCDAPFALDTDKSHQKLHDDFKKLWPNHTGYLRMFGLGIDAYELMVLLPQFNQYPTIVHTGTSGQLHLDAQHQFRRNLSCRTFVQGIPHSITSVQDVKHNT